MAEHVLVWDLEGTSGACKCGAVQNISGTFSSVGNPNCRLFRANLSGTSLLIKFPFNSGFCACSYVCCFLFEFVRSARSLGLSPHLMCLFSPPFFFSSLCVFLLPFKTLHNTPRFRPYQFSLCRADVKIFLSSHSSGSINRENIFRDHEWNVFRGSSHAGKNAAFGSSPPAPGGSAIRVHERDTGIAARISQKDLLACPCLKCAVMDWRVSSAAPFHSDSLQDTRKLNTIIVPSHFLCFEC